MVSSAAVTAKGPREAWPGVDVADADFAAAVERHRPAPEHLADLYLATACAAGNAAALAAFERTHLSQVAAFVARTDSDPAFAEEVRQRLREKLLVGQPPRISEYAGQGPLGGWVRVAAVRMALDLRKMTARAAEVARGDDAANR